MKDTRYRVSVEAIFKNEEDALAFNKSIKKSLNDDICDKYSTQIRETRFNKYGHYNDAM